jgi:hypothetical protein
MMVNLSANGGSFIRDGVAKLVCDYSKQPQAKAMTPNFKCPTGSRYPRPYRDGGIRN